MAESISQESIQITGLPGAVAATRYVGATASGAPATGTFAVGDFVVDQTGAIYICTVSGTPGTWWSTISNHAVLRTATATAGKNEVTIFTGSTASQTISVIATPIDGATWTIINRSSVPVTAGFGASSMLPLGSTSSVTSLVVPVNGAYSFINYAAGQWYMTASNNLANSVGTLSVTNGGTGTATAPAIGSIPLATSTSVYSPLAIGANATVLTSNGTTATWAAPSSGGVTSFTAGTTGLTPNSATTGAVTLAGTLATANGGTNLTTFTAANNALYSTSSTALTAGTLPVAAGGTGLTATTVGGIHVGSSTSAFTNLAIGTSGKVLTSNGTTAAWGSATNTLVVKSCVTTVATGTSAITSISIASCPQAMNSGSTLNLVFYPTAGGSTTTQTVTLSSAVAAGATTLLVNSFTPSINFAIGTEVIPLSVTLPLSTIFPNASQFLITIVSGGGGGGGAGTGSATQISGAGGAAGGSNSFVVPYASTCVVALPPGGYGGTPGATGSNAGGNGQTVSSGSLSINSITYPAVWSAGGTGSAANSTAGVQGGMPYTASTDSTNGFPGAGGQSISYGFPIGGLGGTGGAGGARAASSLGGSASTYPTTKGGISTPGIAGGSATINAVASTNAAINSANGGTGGSAGYSTTGTSAAGGAGGSGYIVIQQVQ